MVILTNFLCNNSLFIPIAEKRRKDYNIFTKTYENMCEKKRRGNMKKLFRRLSGIVLAIVMAFTMLPSLPTVSAAASTFDKQTITMHFKPASQWDKVYTYIKQGGSWDTIPEYSYIGDWPGAETEKDSKNDGWYSFTITMSTNEVHCIFTNNNNI